MLAAFHTSSYIHTNIHTMNICRFICTYVCMCNQLLLTNGGSSNLVSFSNIFLSPLRWIIFHRLSRCMFIYRYISAFLYYHTHTYIYTHIRTDSLIYGNEFIAFWRHLVRIKSNLIVVVVCIHCYLQMQIKSFDIILIESCVQTINAFDEKCNLNAPQLNYLMPLRAIWMVD